MASRKNQTAGNVPGKYYVDDQCIHCGICVDGAPENFRFDESDSYAYVYKQPANAAEESKCASVMEECPVNAIGND